MKNSITKKESLNETSRIETFSDGVFAIAITLLILEIKVPDSKELESGLLKALLEKWPSYLSFFIGFFTVLVCWINHHYMFNRIKTSKHSLILANSAVLFAVSFVPFPTAVLSQAFKGGDLRAAVQLYGLAYILMATVYRSLSSFVYNDKGFTYTTEEKQYRRGIKAMYNFGIVHTITTFVIIYFSVFASLLMYILLFSTFLFPVWYTHLIMKFQNRNKEKQN